MSLEALSFNTSNKIKARGQFGLCNIDDTVYVFGGSQGSLNDFWYINLKCNNPRWIEIEKSKTNWPSKRHGNTLNYYDNNIYLYGGYDGTKYLRDLWKYNILTKKWNKIKTNYRPPKCSEHRTVLYKYKNNGYIILFGGINETSNVVKYNKFKYCYSDIYLYNINDNIWSRIDCDNRPKERMNHAMCISLNRLYIHGGLTKFGVVLNDFYYININDIILNNNPKWIKIENNIGYFHGHLLLSNEMKLYLFGGIKKSCKMNIKLYKAFANDIEFIESYFNIKYNIINVPDLILHLITKFCGLTNFHEIGSTNSVCDHNGSIIKNNCIINNDNKNECKFKIFYFGGRINDNYQACNNAYTIDIN